jgi:hypothetical protein
LREGGVDEQWNVGRIAELTERPNGATLALDIARCGFRKQPVHISVDEQPRGANLHRLLWANLDVLCSGHRDDCGQQ